MRIDPNRAMEFLAAGRIAVVGASDDPKNFGGTVRRALVDHGIDVVVVNPSVATVAGEPSYPSLADVPGDVDGALVMVSGPAVLDVVRAAHARGIGRVWLFKGIGGAGAASDEAVELCNELGVDVVPGACPLMFLEPVGGAHRVHRFLRRINHSIEKAA